MVGRDELTVLIRPILPFYLHFLSVQFLRPLTTVAKCRLVSALLCLGVVVVALTWFKIWKELLLCKPYIIVIPPLATRSNTKETIDGTNLLRLAFSALPTSLFA